MNITHTINEPYRSHLAAAIREIKAASEEELRLQGMILNVRERAMRRRASMEELIMLIRRADELPDAQYTLSEDGSTLTADLPDPA